MLSMSDRNSSGDTKFFGLSKTSLKLEGLDKHLKLIESYQKLQDARREHSS